MTNPCIEHRRPITPTRLASYRGRLLIADVAYWRTTIIDGATYVETVLHGIEADGARSNTSAYGIAHPPIPGRPWWLIEWAPGYPTPPDYVTIAAQAMLADAHPPTRDRDVLAEKRADRQAEESAETTALLGGASA